MDDFKNGSRVRIKSEEELRTTLAKNPTKTELTIALRNPYLLKASGATATIVNRSMGVVYHLKDWSRDVDEQRINITHSSIFKPVPCRKFNIGDRVHIREWDDLVSEYGEITKRQYRTGCYGQNAIITKMQSTVSQDPNCDDSKDLFSVQLEGTGTKYHCYRNTMDPIVDPTAVVTFNLSELTRYAAFGLRWAARDINNTLHVFTSEPKNVEGYYVVDNMAVNAIKVPNSKEIPLVYEDGPAEIGKTHQRSVHKSLPNVFVPTDEEFDEDVDDDANDDDAIAW